MNEEPECITLKKTSKESLVFAYLKFILKHFLVIFFVKRDNFMLAYRVVCFLHQSDRRIRVLSRTNQIIALGYASSTNHTIVNFEYLAPITVFGYCFLVNDVMDLGAMHKEWY